MRHPNYALSLRLEARIVNLVYSIALTVVTLDGSRRNGGVCPPPRSVAKCLHTRFSVCAPRFCRKLGRKNRGLCPFFIFKFYVL